MSPPSRKVLFIKRNTESKKYTYRDTTYVKINTKKKLDQKMPQGHNLELTEDNN